MFCGTGSFSHVDEDPSAPKGSKKKQSSNSNKNPYSTRGLDKFSKVMTELEARRQNIIARAGSGVSMVRFMYTNSQDWIPIIVRLREQPSKQDDPQPPQALPPPPAVQLDSEGVKEMGPVTRGAEPASERKEKKSFSWGAKEGWRRCRPSYNWLLVLMVILFCLVVFGRVFAICCTSIWWYLVPNMKDESGNGNGNGRRSMKKKDFGRRMSDKRLGGGNLVVGPSSQAKRMGGVQELSSPRSRVNGKRG